MGIEDSGVSLPEGTDAEKFNNAMETVDRAERLDASVSPEWQEATTKQRQLDNQRMSKLLEEKALASMAGGPKLSFSEKQEVIAGWTSRLDEQESADLINRLNAVK